MESSAQIRAARALLSWSQGELADKAGISLPTVKRMETQGLDSCNYANVKAVQAALEAAGIRFERGGVFPERESA